MGFVFAWAELSVIRTGGSIAFMAYVFARYATEFYNLGPSSKLTYALLGIIGLTFVNAIGIRPGRIVQNVLHDRQHRRADRDRAHRFDLVLLTREGPGPRRPAGIRAGQNRDGRGVRGRHFDEPARGDGRGRRTAGHHAVVALTMVLVFYAYGGWNEAAFIASEVKDPKRNVRRALIYGTLLVTVTYLAVNLAYLGALGYWGVCRSEAIAADMFALPFGDAGRKAISALVMVSALGSVHGLLFTGMPPLQHVRPGPPGVRLAGRQGRPAALPRGPVRPGRVQHPAHRRGGTGLPLAGDPPRGGRVLRVRTRPVVPHARGHLQAGRVHGPDLLAVLPPDRLFALRPALEGAAHRAAVPGAPVPGVPLVFVVSCEFMLWKSAAYAMEQEPAEAVIVAGLMLLGVPLGIWSARTKLKYQQSDSRY